ncbi:aminotransferase class III-fold pyridoxal phosphate-dependent enzyme [Desulfurococcus mucosus]|uniref:aminotransferase class III-fold pyridoxal phosphate-dependent enzyme n=1 Tax=Desulfurococcus mucosus TaxID=2275 RepID=UPI000AF510D1|nr:aminotransferase class III-fold pyridoxal phosphate-dependent enzyme [Desulfurococcus mucosus]
MDRVRALTSRRVERSLEVVRLDRELFPPAMALKYYPVAVARARGSRVWDLDGNEYIDFLSSAAVCNVGHCHPEVVKAVKEQVDEFLNYTIAYFYAVKPVELAKMLVEITPGGI